MKENLNTRNMQYIDINILSTFSVYVYFSNYQLTEYFKLRMYIIDR